MTTPDPQDAGTPHYGPTVGSAGGGSTPPAAGPATGPATASTTGSATKPSRGAGRAIGRTLALGLLIFVTVVLVLFVVFNTQTVEISLVFTDVRAPLVVALLIAAALGGLLAWLAGTVLRARRRNR